MFPINLLRCQGNLTKTFLCHERSREPPDDLVSQLSQASSIIPKCHDVNERKCMTKALGESDLSKLARMSNLTTTSITMRMQTASRKILRVSWGQSSVWRRFIKTQGEESRVNVILLLICSYMRERGCLTSGPLGEYGIEAERNLLHNCQQQGGARRVRLCWGTKEDGVRGYIFGRGCPAAQGVRREMNKKVQVVRLWIKKKIKSEMH